MTTYHSSLAENQGVFNKLSFRREVESRIEEFRPVVSHKLITKGKNLAVHGQGFSIQVCEPEDGHGRRIITATALQSDKAVLRT